MAGTPAGALIEIGRALRAADLPYMVVGAFAVMVHGLPRTTGDIDVVVHLPFSERARVVPVLDTLGMTDLEERRDEFGQRLAGIIEPGLLVEVFFTPRTIVYDREYDRRVTQEFEGELIPFLSPEDLVLRKLVNTRLRRGPDYRDVVGILAVQGDAVDLAYLRAHAGFYRVGDLLERALAEAREVSAD
jgi:hypothetical protein